MRERCSLSWARASSLLGMLPFMRRLAADRELMGDEALGTGGRIVTGAALALIAASVVALGVLTLLG
jgi:hypothetical protein